MESYIEAIKKQIIEYFDSDEQIKKALEMIEKIQDVDYEHQYVAPLNCVDCREQEIEFNFGTCHVKYSFVEANAGKYANVMVVDLSIDGQRVYFFDNYSFSELGYGAPKREEAEKIYNKFVEQGFTMNFEDWLIWMIAVLNPNDAFEVPLDENFD